MQQQQDEEEEEFFALDKGITAVEAIRGFKSMTHLRVINLQSNRLTTTAGFAGFLRLVELDLSSNSIEDVSGLQALQELRYLNLACNYLRSIDQLPQLRSLEFLNVSMNTIERISKPLELPSLTHLDLCLNDIKTMQDLSGLKTLTALRSLVLSTPQDSPDCCNPVVRIPAYGVSVTKLLPHIEALDGIAVQFDPAHPQIGIGSALDEVPVVYRYHSPNPRSVPTAPQAAFKPVEPNVKKQASPVVAADVAPKKKFVSRGTLTDLVVVDITCDCDAKEAEFGREKARLEEEARKMKSTAGRARGHSDKLQVELTKALAALRTVSDERDSLRQVNRDQDRRIADLNRAIELSDARFTQVCCDETARAEAKCKALDEELHRTRARVKALDEQTLKLQTELGAAQEEQLESANRATSAETAKSRAEEVFGLRELELQQEIQRLAFAHDRLHSLIPATHAFFDALATSRHEAFIDGMTVSDLRVNLAMSLLHDRNAANQALLKENDCLRRELIARIPVSPITQDIAVQVIIPSTTAGVQTDNHAVRHSGNGTQTELTGQDIDDVVRNAKFEDTAAVEALRLVRTLKDALEAEVARREVAESASTQLEAELSEATRRVSELEHEVRSIDRDASEKISDQRRRLETLAQTVRLLQDHIEELLADIEVLTAARQQTEESVSAMRESKADAERFAAAMVAKASALQDELQTKIEELATFRERVRGILP